MHSPECVCCLLSSVLPHLAPGKMSERGLFSVQPLPGSSLVLWFYRCYRECQEGCVLFFPSCCSWFISVSGITLQSDHAEYRIVLKLVRAVLFTIASMILRVSSCSPAKQIALFMEEAYSPSISMLCQCCYHTGS